MISGHQISFVHNGVENQLKLVLDDDNFSQKIIKNHILAKCMYEPETFGVISSILKSGDVFLDIGTHIGFFSLVASRLVGGDGKVFSFELNSVNYEHLIGHIKINEIKNIVPHNWAVSGKSGVIEFWHNQDNDGGHSLWDCGKHDFNKKSRNNPISRVAYAVAIDDYSFGNYIPNLIKIDTEGAEVSVLNGMSNLLKRHKPVVIAEINDFGLHQMGTNQNALRKFMHNLGYYCWVLSTPNHKRLMPNDFHQSDCVYNVLFSTNESELTT